MSRTVLVTGAAGFIGAAIVSTLRNAGVEVLGTDLRADEDVGVLACDIRDARQIGALAKPQDIAAIVHCGAISGPSLLRDDPGLVARTNIEGTINLLEFARGIVSRFVFISSASVYGRTPHDTVVDEDRPLHPSSAYAASKIAGEALVEAYSRQYGFSGVSLRVAAVYGPGRRTPCIIRDMIVAGLEQRSLTVPFGGNQRYHFVHVDDVVAAVRSALDASSFARPAYTIAADGGVALKELARIVRMIVPGPPITVGEAEDPLSDPQGPYALDSAERDLGWRAAIGLSAGIESYARFVASGKTDGRLQINSIA